ncbi:hypothetical protein [Nonomuraea sp. NPDC003709]|uniref:hypothetical protein n=1 Tax=Nonomuraea sp. NPDC003709 TaxID=3154450 RepID=UPI0033BD3815
MPDFRTVGVEPDSLTSLSAEALRRLVIAIATDFGLTFKVVVPKGDHEDLVFTKRVFLSDREVLIRVLHVPAHWSHVEAVSTDAAREGCADALLVAMRLDDQTLAEDDRVLSVERLAGLLSRSALVVPNAEGEPTVDRTGYKSIKQLAEAFMLDRIGLLWLPIFAKNRLPAELEGQGKPEDLFERYFFRLATTALGLQGKRFGTASRGRRVGDALLTRLRAEHLVLTDCKAAAAGYVMDVDDERRLLEYVKSPQEWLGETLPVSCVLIISSEFPGVDGPRHPFYVRREKFLQVGSNLAYLRADDLAAVTRLLLEEASDDTSIAGRINWSEILSEGLIQRKTLLDGINLAKQGLQLAEEG